MKHYGADIEAGRLGPGQLLRLDVSLYSAVRERLAKTENAPTIAEFFASKVTPDKRGLSPIRQRAKACATLLGANEEQAASFLGGLRADRFKTPDNGKRRGR